MESCSISIRGWHRFLWLAGCTLPGVGEQRAQAIIEYREQYGRFAAVEEAAAVHDIEIDLLLARLNAFLEALES